MKKTFFLIVIPVIILTVSCTKHEIKTDLVSFEELDTGPLGYWNGSGGEGGFYSGNVWFVNHYNADWAAWSGFAYTNHTDKQTGDYSNQYSSVAGSGDELSDNYAVFYYSGSPDTIIFTLAEKVRSVALSNSTYAFKVMQEGNDFAKKFGGEDGTDPDWLRLRIKALGNDMSVKDSVDFFMADYRFVNSSDDYILSGWEKIDLSDFGFVKALVFEISSSDTGQWGINTPAYVCLDNIEGVLADAG